MSLVKFFLLLFSKPRLMAPEVLCEPPIVVDEHADAEPQVKFPSGPKTDSWTLGLILLEVCVVSSKTVSSSWKCVW